MTGAKYQKTAEDQGPPWRPSSSDGIHLTRAMEWRLILALLVAFNLFYAGTQRVGTSPEGISADGQLYSQMSAGMPKVLPPQGPAPFVYRLGTPLVVAGLAKTLDWVIAAGFDRINVLFNAVSVVLLALLLQRHVASMVARLLILVAFMVEPHSPFRFSYFYPVNVDPVAIAALIGGLVLIDWFEQRPGFARVSALTLLVTIGVAFHEAVLVIGLCALFSASKTVKVHWEWLPLVGGIIGLTAMHLWVTPARSHSLYLDVARWSNEKTLAQYAVAWLLVFGVWLVMPLLRWREATAILNANRVHLAYLLTFAVLAWIGSRDTERVLAFAGPVVYILIARTFASAQLRLVTVAGLVLVGTQALSSRVFVPIGGVELADLNGQVWERLGGAGVRWALLYDNMWTRLCSPSMLLGYALIYGCLASLVYLSLRHPGDAVNSTAVGRTIEG